MQLSWNPPRLDEQNGAIIYYIVNITATYPRREESFQQNCTMIPCNITQLYPYHTYQFIVSAFTIGPGPYSEIRTVTTLEAGKLYTNPYTCTSTCCLMTTNLKKNFILLQHFFFTLCSSCLTTSELYSRCPKFHCCLSAMVSSDT